MRPLVSIAWKIIRIMVLAVVCMATQRTFAQPANNDPCGAVVLPVNAACANTTGTNVAATATAGPPAPTCGNYLGGDVWYRLVVPAGGSITVTGTINGASTFVDGAMAIYSAAACAGPFAQLACADDVIGLMPQITLTGQTPGATLWIRFWEYGNNVFNTFNICATMPPPAPANDNPCGATTLPVNTTCVNTTSTNVSATATAGPPAPTCSSYLGGDVWFAVTIPAGGTVTITTSTVGGSPFNDSGMALYTAASCAGPFTQVACNDDIAFPLNNMSQFTYTGTPGAVVYVRVWEYGNNVFGTFNICAVMPPPPPTNDNPCTATAVPVNSSCVYQTFTNSTATATAGVPAPGCGFYLGGDVWFTFVAPASGILTVQTAAGTLADATVAVYQAPSCAGPFTEVACADDTPALMPTVTITGLTPGVTYYLRVFGYLGASGSFNLCLHTPALPAGDCVYMLELFDSFGDGWDGSTVGISINGGPFTNYTITGAYGFALIGVNIGQVLVVQYTIAPPPIFQNEISYTLSILSGGGVFSSGSPPATGIVFTQTIDCNPPPAPPEDCIGAITICNGQSFNNNQLTTGYVNDLDPSNYGCLLAAEQQGTWYTWSPSTGGQVGFTINPLGPDDYDWAIWGPYPPGSTTASLCPPSGPPIRCSFASGPSTFTATGDYNTGMGHPIYSPPQWANPLPAYSETAAGDGWVTGLNVIAGQVYLMYISNFLETGLAFDLSWQLFSGASLDCTVLPIELLSFNAEVENTSVEVTWATATESDVDHFLVQRSATSDQFETIGSTSAAGNSMSQTNYRFMDHTPMLGLNHYRLIEVDTDGNEKGTDPITVMFSPGGLYVSEPYPVPATDHLALDLYIEDRSFLTVRILDPTGRILLERQVAGGGSAHVELPCGQLSPGSYACEVRCDRGGLLKVSRWVKR